MPTVGSGEVVVDGFSSYLDPLTLWDVGHLDFPPLALCSGSYHSLRISNCSRHTVEQVSRPADNMGLNSQIGEGVYQVEIRRMGRTESLEPESRSQTIQQSDPVAVVEVQFGAMDLNTVDMLLDSPAAHDPKYSSSDRSLMLIDQLATKDQVASIEQCMRSDRKDNQSYFTRLLQLADEIAHLVYDKAVDLNGAQQSLHVLESQLADTSPRVDRLETAQSRTHESASACKRTLEEHHGVFTQQIQRIVEELREGIEEVKAHALVEARGTKRKLAQISGEMRDIDWQSRAGACAARNDIRVVESDQEYMKARLEQAWAAAGEGISELSQRMDRLCRQHIADQQAVDRFHQRYAADRQAVDLLHQQHTADQQAAEINMGTLATELTVNAVNTRELNAETGRLRSQQRALQEELQGLAEERRASRGRSIRQSDGDVSDQLMTDVPVVHVEIQDRQALGSNRVGPASNVQTTAIAGAIVQYPSLPNIDSLVAGGREASDGRLYNVEADQQRQSKRRREASPGLTGFRRCQTRLQGGRCSSRTERAEGEAKMRGGGIAIIVSMFDVCKVGCLHVWERLMYTSKSCGL